MRALVTGGAGAIGTHLVARLTREGHEVVVLDDLSSGHADLVAPGAQLVVGSVADRHTVDAAFECDPDLVFHLAARFANQNSVDNPVQDLAVTGTGTLHVLEASRRVGADRVLICSSSCVYGNSAETNEDVVATKLDTPYAMTKWLAEGYARFFAAHHGVSVVIVRPFNSYGPHEFPGPYRNVIPNFLRMAMDGRPLTITGSGSETRDFTYVSDVVEGMLGAVAAEPSMGVVFNLASGRAVSILDLATAVNRLVGNEAGVVFTDPRSWDSVRERRGDIERARRAFGYAPKVQLEAGLAETYEWFRSLDE